MSILRQERLEPLLPPRKLHPLGCHNPRVPDRRAMDAICFVLRTGRHWGALDATGICSHRAAHRRLQAWTQVGVFHALWEQDLAAYDALEGLDWAWLAMDSAMTKAPLGLAVEGATRDHHEYAGRAAEADVCPPARDGRGQRL